MKFLDKKIVNTATNEVAEQKNQHEGKLEFVEVSNVGTGILNDLVILRNFHD
jgi:hypothetical protein